jgi:putative FmdB family regulatory protein
MNIVNLITRTTFPFACQAPISSYTARMPLYEFHCENCERDSEILVRSTKWEGTPCPHCNSKRLTKKLSVFASGATGSEPPPVCTGKPRSCGLCGTGKPHSH